MVGYRIHVLSRTGTHARIAQYSNQHTLATTDQIATGHNHITLIKGWKGYFEDLGKVSIQIYIYPFLHSDIISVIDRGVNSIPKVCTYLIYLVGRNDAASWVG